MNRTDFDWARECNYIDQVATKSGRVKEMNYSLNTFIDYCNMQRNIALRDGRFDSAQYIQHILDDMKSKP